ncbi:MAG: hypothetical protein HKN39_01455 [Flavobacteriales bacterium]|nr:hypothetical protein [Flavobacteriales bacterium]
MTYEKKLGVISILFELAEIDLFTSESENEFIYHVAEHLELDHFDIQQMQDKRLVVPFVPPEEEHKRIPIFIQSVMAMVMDRGIDEAEERFCRNLGFRLGLRDEMVNSLIQKWKMSFPNAVPHKELMEVICRYRC